MSDGTTRSQEGPDGPILRLRKSVKNGVFELCCICSGRMVKTIRSRKARSPAHAMRSVPRAHNVTAQGNALGKCETKVQSPTGRKDRLFSLRPFRALPLDPACFLGRCPRLSHCAALRQNASETLSVVQGQKPDKPIPATTPTFAQPSPSLRRRNPQTHWNKSFYGVALRGVTNV